jgi:tetratricopeptide (TPR) repeat protein
MFKQRKAMNCREIYIAAAMSLAGLSPVCGQDSRTGSENSGRDFWRPRNRTQETKQVAGEAERGWNEAAFSSASPSEIKWKPADQLPASPWEQTRTSNPPSSATNQLNTSSSSHFQAGSTKPKSLPHPSNLILQPSSNRRASADMPNHNPAARNPEQAAISNRPEHPFIPVTHATEIENRASCQVAMPQHSPSPASNLPSHHRLQTPMGLEDFQTQAEYLANSPSTVAGVVAGSGTNSEAGLYIEERPIQTFVPEQPAYQAILVSNPINESVAQAETDRRNLAGRVSADILRDEQVEVVQSPRPLEAPAGWKSIEEDLRTRLDRCDELLRRNAILSARDEVLAGLRTLIRAIDLRAGAWLGEPALDQALTALEEEAAFHDSIKYPTRGVSTADIVSRHTTPILKNTDLIQVAPELASQHYRNFARQQLIGAAQSHPWAADLFYALGRTYDRSADTIPDESYRWRNQAIVCYEAALNISPSHAGGSTQLGYALLKLDRVDEAHTALNHSIQAKPSADAWRNLAEVYRRRGQSSQADFATNQVAAIESAQPNAQIPEVINLDPKAFAGISPNQFVGQASATKLVSPIAPSDPPATTKASWFGKLWR